MSEEIPQWAKDRACFLLMLASEQVVANYVVDTFATYIAKHEQPPVDPDVLFVREMMALWMRTPDEFGNAGRGQAGQIERGERDDKPDFQAVLEFYRKHKEVGK